MVGFLIGLGSLRTIFFVTADLGRHLRNGEIFAKLGLNAPILNLNHYSYTHSDFPFINHHWLAGWFYYIIESRYGFSGLSILQMVLTVSTFCLFLVCASVSLEQAPPSLGPHQGLVSIKSLPSQATFGFLTIAVLAWICFPLVLSRTEVRPEAFSYFLCAVVLRLCLAARDRGSSAYLVPLPVIMMIWANVHIYFFCGFLIYGAFLVEDFLAPLNPSKGLPHRVLNYIKDRQSFLLLGLLSLLATGINPIGFELVLYPFKILEDYGYLIAENQSVAFFWRHSLKIEAMWSYYLLATLGLIGIFGCCLLGRAKQLLRAEVFIGVCFCVMGFQAIRNFPLAGLSALPFLATLWTLLGKGSQGKKNDYAVWLQRAVIGFVFIFGTLLSGRYLLSLIETQKSVFGMGLMSPELGGASFAKKIGLKGPFFNNYDIGGYLIYHFFPEERVFVDNRPEAYPSDFFKKTYVPMQESSVVWQENLKRYNFNAIYFYYLDMTPAAQIFLQERIKDPDWVPIYADQVALIMVRKTIANQPIIERYEMPKTMFRFSSSL